MTILVRIFYNTDAEGVWIDADSLAEEDLPTTYHGPFDTIHDAISWMENDYPDGDTDVYDMVADDFDIPADADYINDPANIYEGRDEDIRTDSQEIHGT